MHAWPSAASAGQRAATALQGGYGALGLVAAVVLLIGGRWWRPLLAGWAVCLVATAGLAPEVWGGAGWRAGAAAAAATAVLALGVAWLAHRSFEPTAPQHLPE